MLDNVRIVELPDMRVASVLGYGPSPEDQAVRMIMEYARSIGIEPGSEGYRTFGFDNPSPSPGSPNYGYEKWLVIGPSVEAAAPVEIKQIPGSKYAVTRCVGLENITRCWRELIAWFHDSPYTHPHGRRWYLEEPLSPFESDTRKWVFDLYYPIAE